MTEHTRTLKQSYLRYLLCVYRDSHDVDDRRALRIEIATLRAELSA